MRSCCRSRRSRELGSRRWASTFFLDRFGPGILLRFLRTLTASTLHSAAGCARRCREPLSAVRGPRSSIGRDIAIAIRLVEFRSGHALLGRRQRRSSRDEVHGGNAGTPAGLRQTHRNGDCWRQAAGVESCRSRPQTARRIFLRRLFRHACRSALHACSKRRYAAGRN